ncbi:MAG: urea ABC transporter permease subunit UrtC, partial [Acetobacteraceae bacterium]|nr:urea ABC transporter permease subunit UrtC [Acetobacteraceae bacterium]
AVLVNLAKTWFTAAAPEVWLFGLGALFVLVTLLLPRGLAGLFSRRGRRAPGPVEAVAARAASEVTG